jgi:hypothetical protein
MSRFPQWNSFCMKMNLVSQVDTVNHRLPHLFLQHFNAKEGTHHFESVKFPV